ncbi:hypothetical protein NKH77_16690 [Streptomyces sp. M19]
MRDTCSGTGPGALRYNGRVRDAAPYPARLTTWREGWSCADRTAPVQRPGRGPAVPENIFAVTGLPAHARGHVRRQRQKAEARLAVGEPWPGTRTRRCRARSGRPRSAPRSTGSRIRGGGWWTRSCGGGGRGRRLRVFRGAARGPRRRGARARQGAGGGVGARRGPGGRAGRAVAERGTGWAALLARRSCGRTSPTGSGNSATRGSRSPRRTPSWRASGLLVSPFAAFAADPAALARLSGMCAAWTESAPFAALFSALFDEAVDEAARTIDDGLRSALEKRNAERYPDAAAALRETVLPAYERLAALRSFVSAWRFEEIAHEVSVVLNNVAVDLHHHRLVGAAAVRRQEAAVELARRAYEIAPERDRPDIKANKDVIDTRFRALGQRPGRTPAPDRGAGAGTGGARSRGVCAGRPGVVGVIVLGVTVGVAEALLTGFLGLAVVGLISTVRDAVKGATRRTR